MIHAYNKTFLPEVQQNLGYACHFAINSCCVDTDSFFDFLLPQKLPKKLKQVPQFLFPAVQEQNLL